MKELQKPAGQTNRPGEIFTARGGAPPQSARRLLNPRGAVPQIVTMIEARPTPRAARQYLVSPVEAPALSVTRATPASRPPATRSRAANRPNAITGADGRSAGARLLRDSEAELAGEFFGCEPAGLSPSQRLAISAVAALRVRLEGMRSAVARGDAIDDEVMTRLSNAIGRELSRLERLAASQRKAAKATGGPDALKAYLAAKAAEAAA